MTIAALIISMLLLLSGCGGSGSGGDGGTAGTPPATVSGVAAAGAAIVGTVSLKDSAAVPNVLSQSSSDGSFSFQVAGLTKPFMLKATGAANGAPYTLYSLAGDHGTANINPMSNLVLARGAAGEDLAAVYGAGAPGIRELAGKAGQALLEVQATLKPLLQKYGVAGVDPIRDSFRVYQPGSSAADQMLDRMLDLVQIKLDGSGSVTITESGAAPMVRDLATGFATYSVSGAVTVDGAPLAAVTVTVADASTGLLYGSAESAANGLFLIGNLPPGSYTVTPAKGGYSFDRANSPLTVAAADCQLPAFRSFTPYTVSGTVASANSAGLAGVTVSARRDGSAGVLSAVTDGNGRYAISGLTDGSYTITPSRTDVLKSSAVSFDAASRAATLSNTGNYAVVDFTAQLASFTVSGSVVRLSGGAAMAGVALTLVSKSPGGDLLTNGDAIFSTVSDAGGNYSLAGIPSGYYALIATLKDHAFALSGASSPAATADNFSVNAGNTRLDFTGRPTSDATGGLGGI
ncbi:MAG: hypothetical protein A2075_14170 [Geobacteraceae bacterium GWC2_58_44]|nr:MAG: hypothetical protein A2075_14170 [Geobacteraceae bacterium GWC2_58_44]